MDPASAAPLARIWADAVPLAKVIEDRAEQLCRKTTPARDAGGVRQPSTMELAARMMQYHVNLAAARGEAQKATVNDLIAGRIVGLGRPSDSYNIERLDPSAWIGARLDLGSNAVSRESSNFVEVRIATSDMVASLRPTPQIGTGRPSEAEVIREAIREWAKTDPALRKAPSLRHRGYLSYIAARGYDIKSGRFAPKTLEKYESEYRNQNR